MTAATTDDMRVRLEVGVVAEHRFEVVHLHGDDTGEVW